MGFESAQKRAPFGNYLRKSKKACQQVKKITRTNSRLKMVLGSFAVRVFNGIAENDLERLISKIKYPKQHGRFFYYIDEEVAFANKKEIVGNIPVDYSIVLLNSLNSLKNESNSRVINFLIRTIGVIADKNKEEPFSDYLLNLIDHPCERFEEALQRILFANQLLWQTNHTLVGLGRLDLILTPFLEDDLFNKVITEEEAYSIIKDFLLVLHKHYWYKSNTLIGDTGQIIILGGKNRDGSYFSSRLTNLFIDAIAELNLPDPKILVRCSKNMPRELLEKSIRCMCLGNGSPLLANDEVIIPGLIRNGYSESDAYCYGTSACWEPLIPGKSTDQNNILSFVLPEEVSEYVERTIAAGNEEPTSFADFFKGFRQFLLTKLEVDLKRKAESIHYEKDPIESLFLHNSLESGSDLSEGSVIYNYYGILTPGFSNGINSLLNIKRLVFENQKYSLKDLNEARKNNYEGFDLEQLKDSGEMYGEDNEEVIDITNQVVSILDDFCEGNVNKYGHHYKFGLSSPSYITSSAHSPASFDGRKNNEPFGVHISSLKQLPYTELMDFAAKIDYSKHNIDGNVVDFIVSPNYVENNFEKFVDFISLSISNGFFEMQMNVLSSKVLKDALLHPENHKDLIVRVWGFSSYFNDLPMEYKLLLIKRAEINEGISR